MTALVEAALGAVPQELRAAWGATRLLLRHGGDGPRDTSQAIVFDREGRPCAVARVGPGERSAGLLRSEQARLARLPAGPRLRLPRVLALEDRGDRACLVETYLPGRRLKDRAPGAGEPEELLEALVDWLVEVARLAPAHPGAGAEASFSGTVDSLVERYLGSFRATSQEQRFLAGLGDALRAEAPGSRLVAGHGDLSDANLLVSEDALGVIDWDEPHEGLVPGADLLYLLCSRSATRHGLGERSGFEGGFLEAFFTPGPVSDRSRRLWERYRRGLGLPGSASLALFAATWVQLALHKHDYLAETARALPPGPQRDRLLAEPQRHYPVSFLADGGSLSLALTVRHRETFRL